MKSIAPLLATLAILCSGCGASVAGKYAGKRPVGDGPKHITGTLEKLELELLSNGRFKLLSLSMTYEGNWKRKGDKIEMEITDAGNNPTTTTVNPYAIVTEKGLDFFDPPEVGGPAIPLTKVPPTS